MSNPGIDRFQLQTPERIGKDQKNRFDCTQLSIPPSILHERNVSSFNISSILVVSSVSSWVAVPTRKDPAPKKKKNNTNHTSQSSDVFGPCAFHFHWLVGSFGVPRLRHLWTKGCLFRTWRAEKMGTSWGWDPKIPEMKVFDKSYSCQP